MDSPIALLRLENKAREMKHLYQLRLQDDKETMDPQEMHSFAIPFYEKLSVRGW